MDRFRPYCGKAYAARVTMDDQPSPAWDHPLVVHIRDCETSVIRMPLHVGSDRSRTWVLTRDVSYIDFQHIHVHEDGSPDVISPYGGRTVDAGTATRQSFPADSETSSLFVAKGLDDSITNVWSIDFSEEQTMKYSLVRPGRTFELTVDLSNSVALPPEAWGYNGSQSDDRYKEP